VLLVPTFIAGFFGANTQVPGQGKWWGFGLMVVLMVLGAAGAWALIRPRKDG
jgi:Mg2+ and Co2+ transporter CorA